MKGASFIDVVLKQEYLREEDWWLRYEVPVYEGKDGEGDDEPGQGLPLDEGSQQVDHDKTQATEGCLYLKGTDVDLKENIQCVCCLYVWNMTCHERENDKATGLETNGLEG